MAKQTLAQQLEESFIGIRDEYRLHANTAFRIGTAFLELLRFAKIGEFDEITFNKVLNHPSFLKGLTTLGPIFFGEYAEGLKGGKITEEGIAELKELWVREFTKLGDGTGHVDEFGRVLPALEVAGDSIYSGSLSSSNFFSGFPGGTGWAIQKKQFTNAAGQIEYKYVLECDGANIRGSLRVYEFIMSQLLGENDNRIITAMEEVHHYDPATGKVWLNTNGGKFVMPFRVGDCIMVQQYQPGNDVASGGDGYIIKSYELRITEVGSGGEVDENGDRLDWVKFTAFATTMENGTPVALIEQHDTFCRVDNLTDPERKGIIQLTSVGTNAPYMDIIYGLKTDPDNHLKGRLGNLQGIYHHLFGWLQEFGEYLINAYIVGDVRLRRTGESLDTAVQILQGLVAAKIAETVYEVTDDENYLRNASFMELNLDGSVRDWTFEHVDIMFYTLDGEAVISSVGTLADVRRGVKTETVEGSQVLHIINSSISQSHLVMKQPGTHKVYDEGSGSSQTTSYQNVRDSLYLNMRIRVINPGTLRVGFPDSQLSDNRAFNTKVRVLERSNEWLTLQWEGTWDGESDFFLSFDGECYITALSLTDEPLSEFKTEFSTQFNQTSRNISLIATRTSSNETNIAQLSITATQIQQTVSSNYTALDGRISSNTSAITQTAQSIRQEVSSVAGTASDLSTRVGSLEVTAGSISGRVTAIEGDYVKSASLDLVVRKDASGHLESGVYVSADNITFDFTHTAQFFAVNGDQRTEVMNIRPNGDLWIKGDLLGGNIKGNYTIGSTGNKMQIYCDETVVGNWKASGIRGLDADDKTVLNLGFTETNGSTSPYLSLKGKQAFTQHEVQILIRPDSIAFLPIVGNKPPITFGYALGSNKLYLSTWLEAWPTRDEVGVGQVFLGDDEILRVRKG